VGTDGSETADRAVAQAVELAKLTGARLHMVTAYPRNPFGERLGTTARRQPVDLLEVAEAVTQRWPGESRPRASRSRPTNAGEIRRRC
jgi:nucleotide-binding universal stress UspA family protein